MNASDFISVAALIASAVATTIVYLQNRYMNSLDRRPILVIQFDVATGKWVVQNVGYGPAVNAVVAQQKEDSSGSWYNPVSLPALAGGQSFALEWLGRGPGPYSQSYSLGVRYTDFLDRRGESHHFAYTRDDRCSVFPPKQLPSWVMPIYTSEDMRRYWEHGLPSDPPP